MDAIKNSRGEYRTRETLAAAPKQKPVAPSAARSVEDAVQCFNFGTSNGYTNWNWPHPANGPVKP